MRYTKILLGLTLLAGILFRVAALNDPVTYDEAYTYVAFASRDLWGALSDYSLPNNHIFHTLLAQLSTSLLGNHPWSLRLPAFMAGVAALPLLYLLGKRVYSEETGLAAAALAAICPALARYDTDARGYSLVALFTLLAWLSASIWLETSSRRAWLGLAISVTLGMFTVPTMMLPAGGIFLWALLELAVKKDWKRVPALAGAGFLAVAATLLLYTPVFLVSGWRKLVMNSFVLPVEPGRYFTEILWQRLASTWQIWIMQVPAALAWLALAGVILSLALHRRIARQQIPLLGAILAWVAFYVVLRRPDAFDRFWAFLLPLGLLWASAGLIETAKQAAGGRFRAGEIIGAVTASAVFIASATSIPSIPQRWNKMGNPEGMALALHEILQPGDLVLAGYPVNAPIWYYLGRLGHSEETWKAETFSRVFILIVKNQGQTPERVVRSYKRDPAAFDLPNAIYLGGIGQIHTYECKPK